MDHPRNGLKTSENIFPGQYLALLCNYYILTDPLITSSAVVMGPPQVLGVKGHMHINKLQQMLSVHS